MSNGRREVVWNKGAERDFEKAFSLNLQGEVELALAEIAAGEGLDNPYLELSPHGHPFGNDVWKLKLKSRAGTFRVVYVRDCPEALYVVNAYQKKSKRGSEEPQEHVATTRIRLKWTEAKHQAYLKAKAEQAGREGKR